MAAPRKIYKRTGLRRDRNFADVSDSKQALNNLLDTLVDEPGATFISEDLDPIRNIFTTGISPGEYRGFIGSSVSDTGVDGKTNKILPPVTYQNRLDRFRVTSGEPRLNGGNGLTAKYFNQDQVEDTDDVFTGTTSFPIIESDTFWETGNFNYTGKIHPQSINAAGGVQWEGYFIPTQTGKYLFSTNSSLAFTVDFNLEGYEEDSAGNQTAASITAVGAGNTYTQFSRIGLTTSITGNNATVSGTNVVTVPTANIPFIGVGMTVTASTGTGKIKEDSKVISISRSSGQITLEHTSGTSVISTGAGNVTFGRELGDNIQTGFQTYTLIRGRKYRIRYRVFVPPGTTSFKGLLRYIAFLFTPPSSVTGAYLRYNNLYSLDYDFSDAVKGDIIKFLEQSVLSGGNKENPFPNFAIGGLAQAGYVKVTTDKKVDIKYQPKTSVTQIVRNTATGISWNATDQIITVGDTTNIEVGNYVFGTGLTTDIDTPVRVTQVAINTFIAIDLPANSTQTGKTLTFVDHRGFLKRVTASGSGGTLNLSNGNTVNVEKKQLLFATGSAAYTTITNIDSNTRVTYTPTNAFSGSVYIYQSKGLIDKGLREFCPTTGANSVKCFRVTSAVAVNGDPGVLSTVLPVSTTTDMVVNSTKVQGFPFADPTTITAINVSAGTITVTPKIIRPIVADSNFTATTSSQDKTLCCPPTDTSPPFQAGLEGLETLPGDKDDLKITSGNLIFADLIVTNNSGVSQLNLAAANNSTKRINLKGGDGVVYKLLCE